MILSFSAVSKILHTFKFWFVLLIFYYVFSSSIYLLASLVKHSHFETFSDLAVFNQGIWQYSRFEWPFITLHLDRLFLGDHFHPILILLAPLYWFYSSEKTLLFIQPFIILSAIFPLFLLAARLTRSYFFSFCIIFAYSLYIPLQYTIFYDFHEIVFLPPLFAWAYYFFSLGNKRYVNLFLFLQLLIKEEVGFFVATFALYIMLSKKDWRKFGFVWMVIGLSYSFITMHFIIPKIGGSYMYFDYGNSGKTPFDVILNSLRNPLLFFRLLFDSSIKTETLYRTFWPFAFLPLFSPVSLLLATEQIASRFLDLRTITRWTIGYHYSAPMTVIVTIGSIWSAAFYSNLYKNKKKLVIIFLGIIIVILTRFEQINTSAILLIKNPVFWQRDSWMDNIDAAVKLLPENVSVATQNNISSHVSTRKKVYFLDQRDTVDYIVVDFHKGQSSYNFFNEQKRREIERDVKEEIKEGKYLVIFNKGETYLLKRI